MCLLFQLRRLWSFFLNASPLSCPSTGADTCADMRLQIQNIGHQYQWYLVLVPVVLAAKKFIFYFLTFVLNKRRLQYETNAQKRESLAFSQSGSPCQGLAGSISSLVYGTPGTGLLLGALGFILISPSFYHLRFLFSSDTKRGWIVSALDSASPPRSSSSCPSWPSWGRGWLLYRRINIAIFSDALASLALMVVTFWLTHRNWRLAILHVFAPPLSYSRCLRKGP